MSLLPGEYRHDDPVYTKTKDYEQPKEYFKLLVELMRSDCMAFPISIIDVGCAAGAFLYYLKSCLPTKECVGVDISEQLLQQARSHVQEAEFLTDSILAPRKLAGRAFDVCTCLGTLSIFDEIDTALRNLWSFVKPGGSLYIFDLVNENPVDVLMRYRQAEAGSDGRWMPGFNVRSRATWEAAVTAVGKTLQTRWTPFRMPVAIARTSDPMRAWTIGTEDNPHQITVGTGQLLNFNILRVHQAPADRAEVHGRH